MWRSRFCWIVVPATALLIGWYFWQRQSQPRINVLLITLDTTRADRLGAWNGPEGLTPALDLLASQGIVFERAYAPVPLTLPSHVSLMTGLNPPEHGIRVNSGISRLGKDIPVLAEILQQQGYSTGAFIGAFVLDSKFGLDRGFEIYDDEIQHSDSTSDLDPHDHPMRDGVEVVGSALNWMHGRKDETFFCWVHLFDPHTPYSTREGLFGDRFIDRPYDAGIAYVDLQIFRLLRFLKRQNLEQNTIIIVVGDHGESLGEHSERTHGLTLYESTMHVPLLIRFPHPEIRPRRIDTPISLIDVAPTLLSELEIRHDGPFSGRDLHPAIHGETVSSVPIYMETDHPFEVGGWSPQRGWIADNWKYIRSPIPELYNLAEDPNELSNLAGAMPDQLSKFEQSLLEREQNFVRRDAPTMLPSDEVRRKLASLGYAGGGSPADNNMESLPDIKEMISQFNNYSDAMALVSEQRFPDAIDMLQTVVAASPNYFQAWFNLGYCYNATGNTTEARKAFERAVEIDGNPTARIELGKLYLRTGEPGLARTQLESAVRMQAESATGHFFLGEALRMEDRLEQARRHYKTSLRLDPGYRQAQNALDALP